MFKHFAVAPTVPLPEGEELCRLCSEKGSTCCSTDPELTYLSFPLSMPERRRLLPYAAQATLAPTGEKERFASEDEQAHKAAAKAPDSCSAARSAGGEDDDLFAAPEPNHPDFITCMRALFPGQRKRLEELFPQGGVHFSLRTRTDGACVFLSASGCRLPRGARPWYCLIFPAWISGGVFTLFLSPDCLISQKARGPAHGIELLGLQQTQVRSLHASLRRDWGL